MKRSKKEYNHFCLPASSNFKVNNAHKNVKKP